MHPPLYRAASTVLAIVALVVTAPGQQDGDAYPAAPLPEKPGPLRKPALLLREGKTSEARKELEALRRQRPHDANVLYQIARSYLLDFYKTQAPEKRRVSLGLAMEMLNEVLRLDPNHIPALRAKAVIHARAELLYYDPNLSYQLAERAARLEPNNHAFLLNLSSWMSGEVRFTEESGHRVPHDPLIGLDRSIDLLDQVMDNSLSRRGNFREAISYYQQELTRNVSLDQRAETLREMGACYYRLGEYVEAARKFYEAMQWKMNSIDQWLFHVALDQIRGPRPPLPETALFPVQTPKIDPANPPLLAFED